MDKKTFDVLTHYTKLVSDLHSTLEQQLGLETADNLVKPFDDFHAKELKVGNYQDESNVVQAERVLSEAYEDLKSHTKVMVIYQYDNGYSLCEVTDGSFHLVPSNIIR